MSQAGITNDGVLRAVHGALHGEGKGVESSSGLLGRSGRSCDGFKPGFEIVALGVQKGKIAAKFGNQFREFGVVAMKPVNARLVLSGLVGQCSNSFLISSCASLSEQRRSFESSGSPVSVVSAFLRFGLARDVKARVEIGIIAVRGGRFQW